LETIAVRRKCANCGHWAPLIVTSAIRPKRTKQLIWSNGKMSVQQPFADFDLIDCFMPKETFQR
jgi:hypothetical protein